MLNHDKFYHLIIVCIVYTRLKTVSNPELMTLMRNPKMQDIMKLMMTDGSEALEKAMQEDQEVFDIITKLNAVMGKEM